MKPTLFIPVQEIQKANVLPINTLLFSEDGQLLLTGGDDCRLDVWSTETHDLVQELDNVRLGQISNLTWIVEENSNFVALSVATGRGFIALYPFDVTAIKPFDEQRAVTKEIFASFDAVESQAADPVNRRLALASHSGEVRMYGYDVRTLSLQHLWTLDLGSVIPVALFFSGDRNNDLLSPALQTSELTCIDAANKAIKWKKVLTGGTGNAALSVDRTTMVVGNLSSGGFDVYRIPEGILVKSFPIASEKRFTKQVQLTEDAKIAICGSNSNRVQVVDVERNEVIQNLTTGKDGMLMTQAVAITSRHSEETFIAGAHGNSIYIWEREQEKLDLQQDNTDPPVNIPSANAATNRGTNIPLVVLIIVLTYGNWAPYVFAAIASIMEHAQVIINHYRPVVDVAAGIAPANN